MTCQVTPQAIHCIYIYKCYNVVTLNFQHHKKFFLLEAQESH